MVLALKTPRQQHALGGVLSKMRGEILRQGPQLRSFSLRSTDRRQSRRRRWAGRDPRHDRDLRRPENGCRVSPCYR